MPRGTMSIEQALSILTDTPPRLAAISEGVSPALLRTAPTPDEWSANEVLAHLRACADVWGNAVTVILAQDQPTLKAMNPRTWITRTDYLEQAFHPSLRAFTVQRAELLTLLNLLSPEQWALSVNVTGAGKPIVRTVKDYAEWMAEHERPHVKQIEFAVKSLQT